MINFLPAISFYKTIRNLPHPTRALALRIGMGSVFVLGTSAAWAAPLNGTYTIDKTQPTAGTNFQTMNEAFGSLNSEGITGNVVFEVTAGQVFDVTPLILAASGTSGATITFRRTGSGTNPLIQGSNGSGAADAIITLRGSDYVTFDGIDLKDKATNSTDVLRMERGLLLQAIAADNGCQHVTYKNGTVTLTKTNANTTTGIGSEWYVSNTGEATVAAGTNSYLSFLSNTVQSCQRGYSLSGGNATVPDNSNYIGTEGAQTSSITDLAGGTSGASGVAVVGVNYSNQTELQILNTTISSGTAAGHMYGINSGGGANNTVSIKNNVISGLTKAKTSGAGDVCGINLGFGSAAVIADNTISDLTNYHAGGVQGISVTKGRADIYGNGIHDLSTNLAGSNSGALAGIEHTLVTGQTSNIYRNKIFSLTHTTTSTGVLYGIQINSGGGSSSALNLYNNLISGLRNDASTGAPCIRGVQVLSGGTNNLYYNTISMSGTATNTGHQSAALYFNSSAKTLDYSNNILVNAYELPAGAAATAYAVAIARNTGTSITLSANINNNLVYGRSGVFFDGTALQASLDNYRTAMGGNRESRAVSEIPTFVDAVTNPHLNPKSTNLAKGGAKPITGYETDYDNDTRDITTPDIGADEIKATLPVSLVSFLAVRQGTNALLTWTTAQEKNCRGFAVQVSIDGNHYHELGFVRSESANSGTQRSYRFLDTEAGKQGLRYYRLRQLDVDGAEVFYNPKAVVFQVIDNQIFATPIPFRHDLTLTVQTRSAATVTAVSLTNAAGRTVITQVVNLPPGASQVTLQDLDKLPSGVYILHLDLDGQTQHLRVMKE
ncbi:T9SS type A sorting domain-containing protein [Hymenobacter jejuensis]|uniref:T9SS type A sorting domain-containing protein n=1 Tax=Hymenobacter jejuensis TaxID=2502781 RepID=A0A5B7ZXD1_9BACT|nr:T9SS type A sorting domain-containing protein [Hymenobacter jejuensis]QDA59784.1 T9SS type A sorting domain-containing protein [Hymenobacter jejuensis]